MCYYCQAATHNLSDTIPTYYWWWWGNEHKTHKYLAWNKANTSAALKQSAEVNRERQTAVGWKWCHFICHLTVSLWTAYSWGIHPCLVHLGAIARVPTQTHSNTHTHTESQPVSQPLRSHSSQRWPQNGTKMSLLFFALLLYFWTRLQYHRTWWTCMSIWERVVCFDLHRQVISRPCKRLLLEHNGSLTSSMTAEFVYNNSHGVNGGSPLESGSKEFPG